MAIGAKFTSQLSPKTLEIDFRQTYKYIFIALRLLTNNATVCDGFYQLFATELAFWRILVFKSCKTQGSCKTPCTTLIYIGSTGEQVMARNGDIRGNALFTIVKREIPIGFLLLGM